MDPKKHLLILSLLGVLAACGGGGENPPTDDNRNTGEAPQPPTPGSPTPAPGTSPVPPSNPDPAPQGSVVWRGDFETGDYTQYTGGRQETIDNPDPRSPKDPVGRNPQDPTRRLAIVKNPVMQGKYALKVTVKKGDINNKGTRNELVSGINEPAGSEYYYRWSIMFDANYPIVDKWQLFAQWHHSGNDHSPPLSFNVRGEDITLQHNSDPYTGKQEYNTVKLGKLQRGVWTDFIAHIKWSPDRTVGFIEVYMNCKLVMPRKYTSTQYTGQLNHLKVGLYRHQDIEPDGIVIHDGWVMGKTLSDVQAPGERCAE